MVVILPVFRRFRPRGLTWLRPAGLGYRRAGLALAGHKP